MNEDKVQQLRRYRGLLAEILRQMQEIERCYSIAEKVTPSLCNVRFSPPDGSRIENAVEKIDTLRELLVAQLGELAERREQIERAVNSVPDERLRLLLRYRYIDGLTFEAMAERMGLSVRWVLKLHKKALEIIEVSP